MSTLGKRRVGSTAPPPRKPSPERNSEETLFQQKLEEIKKMRSEGAVPRNIAKESPPLPPPDNKAESSKKVLTVHGYKTFRKSFGDWSEVVSGSGKVYFYNKKTLVNQWKKPAEWVAQEELINCPLPPLPPLPPDCEPPERPPQPPQPPDRPPEPPTTEAPGDKLVLKMKIKGKKKVKKRVKNPEAHLPLAYQTNAPRRLDSDSEDEEAATKKTGTELTIENAFEDPDEEKDEKAKISKLDPKDESGQASDPNGVKPEEPANSDGAPADANSNGVEEKKEGQRFVPNISGPERAENLFPGSAARLAFENITKLPEATAVYGENPVAPPASMPANPTYFNEYNLPCCLKRCKFPKEQDVLHELKINKLKRRNFLPPPLPNDLSNAFPHLAEAVQMEQFYTELKNPNNRDRLLTQKMNNLLVYKITDEIWDRYFTLFQVKIFDGVFLECKPAGYTHNDEVVYSRTGKICGHKTFPEDEARCQAVLQAWKKDYCLCVYANRTFTVRRDDDDWEDDLRETRRFLEKNGY